MVVAVLAMNRIPRAYQCPLRPIGVMQFSSSIVIESVSQWNLDLGWNSSTMRALFAGKT